MIDTTEYLASLWTTNDENGAPRPTGVPAAPKIAANEDWREKRLLLAWGYASALVAGMSNAYRQRWNGAIVSLDDRKGVIQVTWRDEISRIMFEGVILGGWEANGDHAHHQRLAK
ncbi:MAG TPA: hypothetical protein VM662_16705 [Sphingomonas sp.]|nr:hypothetical protein [Sphingomonas sp.]